MKEIFITKDPITDADKAGVTFSSIKTGTTIVGLRYTNGVILAADTRSTSGPIVADKNCEKIHFLSSSIYACGAGTAADADRITKAASSVLAKYERFYDSKPFVSHCCMFLRDTLYEFKGSICAALVVGGCDSKGAHLKTISPHGYINDEAFIAMGSGYYAAMGVLEQGFAVGLSKEQGLELAVEAVTAGIMNDLYSGSNVDCCVISKDGSVEMLRNYRIVSAREDSVRLRKYPRDSIRISKEQVLKMFEIKDENE